MVLSPEKFKEDIQRIMSDLDKLQKDRKEAGEEREEIGQDIDVIVERVNNMISELGATGEDVEEIKEDVESIKQEVKESGEDVEEIKEDVEDIKKEIDETGEHVEDIKENIEDIKEDISALKEEAKKENLFSRVAHKVLPDKFEGKDIAQQIVGATILSAPFSVTEEVWRLAQSMTTFHITAIILITICFDILLYYYAKFRHLEEKKYRMFPVRVLSLLVVTYLTSTIVLSALGVIGGQIEDPVWAAKLVITVGLFSNIGAGTADLIK